MDTTVNKIGDPQMLCVDDDDINERRQSAKLEIVMTK